jgi:2-keto-4-pentenoate hydratase
VVEVVGGRLSEAGAALEPGDRIIAGALIPVLPAAAGGTVALDLGPLGAVSLRYR